MEAFEARGLKRANKQLQKYLHQIERDTKSRELSHKEKQISLWQKIKSFLM
jgi:hypothetical protein